MSQLDARDPDPGAVRRVPARASRLSRIAAAQGKAAASAATAAITWRSVVPVDRAGAARRVFGTDLDHLTDDDRRLIHAVTGEVIWRGQVPHERPLSAFAMQIAVDRRTGELPAKRRISMAYLTRTGQRLTDLGAPANPFTGANLERARTYLVEHESAAPEGGQ